MATVPLIPKKKSLDVFRNLTVNYDLVAISSAQTYGDNPPQQATLELAPIKYTTQGTMGSYVK